LLVGYVEYDTGNRQAAETTRQAALSLGSEADHGEIIAWAHQMRAWINLTSGDYHGVVAASRAGKDVTPYSSVAVQFAQEAKAWARIGDRRQTEVALNTDGLDPALLANRTAMVRAAWAGNGNRKTRAWGGADIW
jgi:hypothetical protein